MTTDETETGASVLPGWEQSRPWTIEDYEKAIEELANRPPEQPTIVISQAQYDEVKRRHGAGDHEACRVLGSRSSECWA